MSLPHRSIFWGALRINEEFELIIRGFALSVEDNAEQAYQEAAQEYNNALKDLYPQENVDEDFDVLDILQQEINNEEFNNAVEEEVEARLKEEKDKLAIAQARTEQVKKHQQHKEDELKAKEEELKAQRLEFQKQQEAAAKAEAARLEEETDFLAPIAARHDQLFRNPEEAALNGMHQQFENFGLEQGDMDEDTALALAIEMSKQDQEGSSNMHQAPVKADLGLYGLNKEQLIAKQKKLLAEHKDLSTRIENCDYTVFDKLEKCNNELSQISDLLGLNQFTTQYE